MCFTPAKFNAGLKESETSIVTRYPLVSLSPLTSIALDLMLSPGIFERFSKIIPSHTEFGSIQTMLSVTISVSARTRI